MSDDYQRIAVITGTARRRRWSTERKLEMVEETLHSGESISAIAAPWCCSQPAVSLAPADDRGRSGGGAGGVPLIRRLVDERPTYGYRRITALVNRELAAKGAAPANHKRVYRLMKIHGLLLEKHSGRRPGRTPLPSAAPSR